jgi:hypothetical protein
MEQYERLLEQLKSTPFLVADGATGEVKLVREKDALRLLANTGLFNSKVIMNVGRALENFGVLIGKADRTFGLRDIATMTGTPYSQAYNWIAEKVIVPSVRPTTGSGKGKDAVISWTDGFIAGICGSLRRQGVRLEMLRGVSPLFTTKKQAPRKLAASTRP